MQNENIPIHSQKKIILEIFRTFNNFTALSSLKSVISVSRFSPQIHH